eukprot:scaffold363_cov331-Pavlova_lutheri.AAC.117
MECKIHGKGRQSTGPYKVSMTGTLLRHTPCLCCIRQWPPPVNEAHQGPSRPWLTGPNHRGYPSSKGSDIPLEYNDSTVPEPEPVSPGRIEARSPPDQNGLL